MAEETKDGLPILLFNDQPAWEAWLEGQHARQDGIWLKVAKKGSGVATVNYDEALESSLCYGWIDSQIRSFDSQVYLIKFSPRRARSKWSKMNREKAEMLISSGRMQPAGLEQVELARADGRWENAYDPQSQITVPDDLQHELDRNPAAKEFFGSLNSMNRYAILYRIQDAKSAGTREKRIHKFVDMLANHQKPHP